MKTKKIGCFCGVKVGMSVYNAQTDSIVKIDSEFTKENIRLRVKSGEDWEIIEEQIIAV